MLCKPIFSLKTGSERGVPYAIRKSMSNSSSQVIALRLSTIRHAAEIIVLQNGAMAVRRTDDRLNAGMDLIKNRWIRRK
jgi:ABC-type transport system involved in Fe-S cluster assembly fused permease/ATPase subunit